MASPAKERHHAPTTLLGGMRCDGERASANRERKKTNAVTVRPIAAASAVFLTVESWANRRMIRGLPESTRNGDASSSASKPTANNTFSQNKGDRRGCGGAGARWFGLSFMLGPAPCRGAGRVPASPAFDQLLTGQSSAA